jgi:polysaccharide deacetylase family protein (PEP-CTERM system associated)
MEKINAFSIDLEEWYHSELVGGRKSPSSQATEATQPILDLLDRYQTKASFFVVGEVAEQNPDLIRSIYEGGHEIGCHTFSHKLVWNLDENLFRGELERFHSVMEKILGKVKMKGFRAPCFSIDNRNTWALKVLSDFGYQYDASIFPLKINPLYGVSKAPNRPYRISFEDVRKEDPQSPLIEFPMCPLRIGRLKIPIAGGFYLRMFPLPFLSWGLKRINQSQSFILYVHPWESYEKTPRLKLPLYNRIISYYGIDSVMIKLEYLLKHFLFTRVDRVLGIE